MDKKEPKKWEKEKVDFEKLPPKKVERKMIEMEAARLKK